MYIFILSSVTMVKKMNTNTKQSGISKVSKGDQMGLHGAIYQLKLFMLFLYRGVSRAYSFRVGREIEEAKKFDDIVFEYTTTDGKKVYRFLQVKHKSDDSMKITLDNLLTNSDGDYSIPKYFFSYMDSKKEKMFRESSIKDVTVFTNIDFDSNSEDLKDLIDHIDEPDDFLDVKLKTKQSKRYKFNQKIVPKLKEKVIDYNLTKLAKRLVECFLNKSAIKHHEVTDMFKSYHLALAKEVINIKTKRFHVEFLKGDESLSENGKQFRKCFQEELNIKLKRLNKNLSLVDINKAIENKTTIIDNKEVGLDISKKFGIPEKKRDGSQLATVGTDDSKIWPDNARISDDEIKDFLSHLVFAVNQPNQNDLDDILKDEIGKEFGFDLIKTKDVYNEFFTTKLDWFLREKSDRFCKTKELKSFFEDVKKNIPIWFDIKKPVDSFVGREAELEELHIALQTGCATAILQLASINGLGGIGKSELARKYINVYSGDYDNRIIWINAETYQSLSQSFHSLAEDMLRMTTTNLEGKPEDIKSIVRKVYTFFSSGKCLFVFDNAENSRTINEFLSPLPDNVNKPYVLITSRTTNWGDIKVITLNVFTEDEAMDFIKKTLHIDGDSQEDEIRDIARLLQYFPLALQQAVAYINKMDVTLKNIGSKFSIVDYIKRYHHETKTLLDFQFPDDSSDSYTKTTYTTWRITIDKIKENPEVGREAEQILKIIAYLDAENVNTSTFLPLMEHDEEKLESAIELLRQYSMIYSERGRLSVHRLVQQVIRIDLKEQNEMFFMILASYLIISFLCAMKVLYFKNLRQPTQHLYTVLKYLNNWMPKNSTDMEIIRVCTIDLLNFMIECYIDSPHLHMALIERTLRPCKGIKHIDFARLLMELSIAYFRRGDYLKQKESLEEAISIYQQFNCPKHLEIARARRELGVCYGCLGEHQKSKELLEQVLIDQQEVFGFYHEILKEVLTDLYQIYEILGDYQKRKKVWKREFILNCCSLEPTVIIHRQSYVRLRDIPLFYSTMQRHLKTTYIFHSVAQKEIRRVAVFLSKTYRDRGNEETRKLLKRALSIFETNGDAYQVCVTTSQINLAQMCLSHHNLYRARELMKVAIQNLEKYFGSEHLEVAPTQVLHSLTYAGLGDFEKQKDLLEGALSTIEKHYGPMDDRIIVVRSQIEGYNDSKSDLQRQIELAEKTLPVLEQNFGRHKLCMVNPLMYLSIAYQTLGDHQKEIKLIERVLDIEKKHYGADAWELVTTVEYLTNAYEKLGNIQKRDDLHHYCLNIRKRHKEFNWPFSDP